MSIYKKPTGCQIKNIETIYTGVFGKKTDGLFVEVGAFNGVNWSNTSNLLDLGWTGIYYEPHPQYFADLQKNLGNHPRATLVNKAISDFSGEAPLYLGGSVSTLVPEMRDAYAEMPEFAHGGIGKGESTIVRVEPLLDEMIDLIGLTGHIDLLVVDVEGSELNVLSNEFLEIYAPLMVIVEAHTSFPDRRLSAKSDLIKTRMYNHLYERIYSDHINDIYVFRSVSHPFMPV